MTLGMSAAFDASASVIIDAAEHHDRASKHVQICPTDPLRVWSDIHISPWRCPSSTGVNLCTYLHCFLRHSPLAEPELNCN